jgi:glycerophosphoryl diester phosphodiesterase
MTNVVTEIWREALGILRKNIAQIFTTHLAYIALGVILFAPLVGMLGHLLLHLSGKTALSDLDIAWFLLSPPGMVALILMAALLIAILAFEQASLMAISTGSVRGLHIGTLQALHFTARRAARIFLFTTHLVARVLMITLPFLAAGGAIAWLLLTEYDINYYLTAKPPVFLIAAAAIGLLLLTMLVVLVRKLIGWSLALPLVLFTDTSPAGSFAESCKLVQGHKREIVTVLLGWAVAALLLGAAVVAIVQLLGSLLAPMFFDSIKLLVIVLGGVMALWSLGNLVVTTLTSGSFAALVVIFFEHYGPISTSDLTDKQPLRLWRMTPSRLALLLIGAAVAAALSGSWLLKGIQTQDDVLVIAHRGAAGKAPENTLASMRQAIDDGADMIEIDVQESSDGEVVVIHDSDFMKLSGVDLKVWDGSLKQLQEIDIGSWFDPGFSAERVPTLAQVLEEARGKVRVIIELKYYGHDRQLEQRIIEIVEKAGMVDDIFIMSLEYKGIEKIRALRPQWVIGLLSTRSVGNLAKLDLDFLAVNMSMATSGFIHRTHAAGKKVFVWTVNDAVSISRMISLGVDGIITDEPEMARKVVTERSGLSSVERLLIHTAVLFGRPIPPRIYRDESP